MTQRLHNFNAGPATLPLEVLQHAQKDLVCYPQAGMSVMEMSHRSPNFAQIIDRTRSLITELYDIPDTHEVLFLQGGASLQFVMIPLNLGEGGAYINTGTWSTRALAEAQVVGQADEVWSSQADSFNHIPIELIQINDHHTYLHFTSNNTIYGTQYSTLPSTSSAIPFVADVSSDFFSKKLDLSRFDIAYGGAQKNAGPSGVTILIIRKSISQNSARTSKCPKILQYQTHAQKGSMYNTPNTFGIYLLSLMAQWMSDRGGLDEIEYQNRKQADIIYSLIDQHSDIYQGHARKSSRSLMNITFRLTDPARQNEFLEQAETLGLVGLKGHRSVGGLRASLYNALSDKSVDALASFLSTFAQQRRHQ